MKEFEFLKTDFYQLNMCLVYILTDTANDKTGFEAYFRRINSNINPTDNFYYFGGGNELIEFMDIVKKEIRDPEFIDSYISILEDKLPKDKKELYIRLLREKWPSLIKEFYYTIYPKNVKIFPYVPAFQYYGPKWIGTIAETRVVNTINGKTGFYTKEKLHNFESAEEKEYLHQIVYGDNGIDDNCKYLSALSKRANEFRLSTSKILLEAAFRRAPGFVTAKIASIMALRAGWNGTSNTSLAFGDEFTMESIGGTMAHSFVMSHPTQIEAVANWNMIYPKSTILTCTYDVEECIEELIKYNIKPAMVRIDVEPLDELARITRKKLNAVGWNDVKIFLSGDLTPERLRKFEEDEVPFDACMAGTAYVNIAGVEKVNAGFVYKLVQFEKKNSNYRKDNGIINQMYCPQCGTNSTFYFPEKKASGKNSHSSLKTVTYDKETKTLRVHFNTSAYDNIVEKMGYYGFKGNDEIENVEIITDDFIKKLAEEMGIV